MASRLLFLVDFRLGPFFAVCSLAAAAVVPSVAVADASVGLLSLPQPLHLSTRSTPPPFLLLNAIVTLDLLLLGEDEREEES